MVSTLFRCRIRTVEDRGGVGAGAVLEGRKPPVNENQLREENERLADQLRKDAEALERLRLELEELRRQREYERDRRRRGMMQCASAQRRRRHGQPSSMQCASARRRPRRG